MYIITFVGEMGIWKYYFNLFLWEYCHSLLVSGDLISKKGLLHVCLHADQAESFHLQYVCEPLYTLVYLSVLQIKRVLFSIV